MTAKYSITIRNESRDIEICEHDKKEFFKKLREVPNSKHIRAYINSLISEKHGISISFYATVGDHEKALCNFVVSPTKPKEYNSHGENILYKRWAQRRTNQYQNEFQQKLDDIRSATQNNYAFLDKCIQKAFAKMSPARYRNPITASNAIGITFKVSDNFVAMFRFTLQNIELSEIMNLTTGQPFWPKVHRSAKQQKQWNQAVMLTLHYIQNFKEKKSRG